MKKIILILIALFVIGNVFAATNLNFTQNSKEKIEFTSGSSPHFVVKDIRQDPFPANPGSSSDIYFRVDNLGGEFGSPKFDLILTYPFSLDQSSKGIQEFPALEAGDKLTLHYKINIDKDAVPGDYEVQFVAYAGSGTYYPYFFDIKVDDVTTDFDVAIQDVTKDGVAIAISNIGKNTANAITIILDNQENFDLLGTPSYIIGNLNSGDYTIVSAFIKPKENLNGELKMKVDIDYTDIIGNRRKVHKEIPVLMTTQTKKGFDELTSFVVYNGEEPNKNKSSNIFMYISLILALGIIGLIIYYKRKKNEDN